MTIFFLHINIFIFFTYKCYMYTFFCLVVHIYGYYIFFYLLILFSLFFQLIASFAVYYEDLFLIKILTCFLLSYLFSFCRCVKENSQPSTMQRSWRRNTVHSQRWRGSSGTGTCLATSTMPRKSMPLSGRARLLGKCQHRANRGQCEAWTSAVHFDIC